ncbi:MAG: hypothetical protein AAGF79_02980, partial [Pseudomonadota bacterium]
QGHRVTSFTRAPLAVSFLNETTVDLVIAGAIIRGEDGFAQSGGYHLLQALRKGAGDRPPTLAISGSFLPAETTKDLTAAPALGATATLAKPFAEDDLSATVNRLLGSGVSGT